MKGKQYPAYKPSGVEWLGEVPEHWEVKRARFMFSMNPSKQEITLLNPETELTFLPMEAIGEDGVLKLDTTRPLTEVSSGYTFFAENDVTFAKITPCFENGKGAIMRNLESGFGFGTTELTVIRPGQNLNVEYLYYLTISNEFRKTGEAWMYGAGGQKRVPDEFVKEFRFGFPPLPEQQAIAAFLDRETAKIDALIEKKKKLLELLKEKRTALISRAVTKGLAGLTAKGDKEFSEWAKPVKMKPSGIEWLGEVPEHWEVKRLKYSAITIMGQSPNSDEYSDDFNLLPFLQGNADFTNLYPVPHIYCATANKKAPKNSLLISVRAPVGALNEADQEYGIGRGLSAIIPKIQLDKRFAWFSIHITREELVTLATGSTYDAVSTDEVGNMLSPLPPLSEQQAIAAFLDRETAKLDALSAKVETAIEKLKEYRTALISAAVTGKIDVREAV